MSTAGEQHDTTTTVEARRVLDAVLFEHGYDPHNLDFGVFGWLDENYRFFLRRHPPRQAANYAIARCLNMHEQRQRRSSHDTGYTEQQGRAT